MTAVIVRRFNVHTPAGTAPDAVKTALDAAASVLPQPGRPIVDPAGPTAAGTVAVRLEGSPAATAEVQAAVRNVAQARVHRDLIDLPPGAPQDIYPDQRVLARIDPNEKSLAITTVNPVVVAILDSGVMPDHPDLANRLLPGDRPVLDDDGHGTMLAGTVLGTAPNARGLRVLPVKFFGAGREPTAEGAAEAIAYAVDRGAHIINLSFDLGVGSTELEEAIQAACNKDVLVVLAAGNTGSNNDAYRLVPARYAASANCRARTIVVMATDWYDERPTFSNFGRDDVDLAAPGVRVLSTRASWRDGRRYRRYTGTSPAAACVSGAAALLKSLDPSMSAEKLKSRLMDTADELPSINRDHGRRLNLGRALP